MQAFVALPFTFVSILWSYTQRDELSSCTLGSRLQAPPMAQNLSVAVIFLLRNFSVIFHCTTQRNDLPFADLIQKFPHLRKFIKFILNPLISDR
jgi:hypothetical protein